jgi:autoinducer 2-degrading protein
MAAHVIIVRLRIKPEFVEIFEREMRAHIATTLRTEPGCTLFDVSVDKRDARTYHLYEVYEDDAALAAHRKSASLVAIRDNLAGWTEDRAYHESTLWERAR